MTILDFGKYKGRAMRDVPRDYLLWLIEQSQKRIAECQAELDRREVSEEAALNWEQRIVRTGFRELAKRHHPDHGGSNETMRAINAALANLEQK